MLNAIDLPLALLIVALAVGYVVWRFWPAKTARPVDPELKGALGDAVARAQKKRAASRAQK